jgi:hypothetical protein
VIRHVKTYQSFRPLSNKAFTATITVLSDMNIAATAG